MDYITPDIIKEIIIRLDNPRDIISLGLINKYLYNLCSDKDTWIYIFDQNIYPLPSNCNIVGLYKWSGIFHTTKLAYNDTIKLLKNNKISFTWKDVINYDFFKINNDELKTIFNLYHDDLFILTIHGYSIVQTFIFELNHYTIDLIKNGTTFIINMYYDEIFKITLNLLLLGIKPIDSFNELLTEF